MFERSHNLGSTQLRRQIFFSFGHVQPIRYFFTIPLILNYTDKIWNKKQTKLIFHIIGHHLSIRLSTVAEGAVLSTGCVRTVTGAALRLFRPGSVCVVWRQCERGNSAVDGWWLISVRCFDCKHFFSTLFSHFPLRSGDPHCGWCAPLLVQKGLSHLRVGPQLLLLSKTQVVLLHMCLFRTWRWTTTVVIGSTFEIEPLLFTSAAAWWHIERSHVAGTLVCWLGENGDRLCDCYLPAGLEFDVGKAAACQHQSYLVTWVFG